MIEPTPSSPEKQESSIEADPMCNLEANAITKLESLARAWGVSMTEALHQLIETRTRHTEPEETKEPELLTAKQAAVLKSLKAGLSVKEIAGQFGVSEGTVRTHIRRMRCHFNRSDLLSLRYL